MAARIEGLAEPGGVPLSGSAWDQVHKKLEFVFESLGNHNVKNISRPIRVYRIRAGEVGSGGLRQVFAREEAPSVTDFGG